MNVYFRRRNGKLALIQVESEDPQEARQAVINEVREAKRAVVLAVVRSQPRDV